MPEQAEGGDFFSLCSYVANTEEDINLVKSAHVYVFECQNFDQQTSEGLSDLQGR